MHYSLSYLKMWDSLSGRQNRIPLIGISSYLSYLGVCIIHYKRYDTYHNKHEVYQRYGNFNEQNILNLYKNVLFEVFV